MTLFIVYFVIKEGVLPRFKVGINFYLCRLINVFRVSCFS